jgi:hypothetical protein
MNFELFSTKIPRCLGLMIVALTIQLAAMGIASAQTKNRMTHPSGNRLSSQGAQRTPFNSIRKNQGVSSSKATNPQSNTGNSIRKSKQPSPSGQLRQTTIQNNPVTARNNMGRNSTQAQHRSNRSRRADPSSLPVASSIRTAIQVLGEERFREMGLPAVSRNLDLKTALHLASQKLIRDKYGIPHSNTQNMASEDMLEVVGQLQFFDAEEYVNSEKFWRDVSSGGVDVALGPIVGEKLGLPAGVRAGSPASKVLEDAGQLQTFDLDLADRGSWSLLNEFQNGKLTPDQFADRVNQIKSGRNGSGGGTVGGHQSGTGRGGMPSPNTRLGTDGPDVGGIGNTLLGGQNSSGKSTSPTEANAKSNSPPSAGSSTTPPGSRGGNTGGGGTTPGSDSTGSTPPGSRNSGAPASGDSNSGSNTGAGQSGSSPESPGSAGNDSETPSGDGESNSAPGSTSDLGETPSAGGKGPSILSVDYVNIGGATWVAVAYSDGTYVNTLVDNTTGEVIKTETGKTQDNEEPEVVVADSNGNDSSSDSDANSENDSDSDSDSDADVDTTDVDEYTPGRDGEYIMPLAQRLTYMQSLMQALNATKWTPGQGGTESTPNPMNHSFGRGTRPYNPKDTVKKPIDGSSMNSSAKVPIDAWQKIQDPMKVQGDVIDPIKN